jgi:hypothetical protein
VDELIAHLFGDYVVQSTWMAERKLHAHGPALAHALTYAACFVPLTKSPARLAIIASTHFAVDRWRLARYLVWAKNQAAPRAYRYELASAGRSGYVESQPWLHVWLGIIADKSVHLLINRLALRGARRG